MRTIKFRAKVQGTSQWIYGIPSYVYGNGIDCIIQRVAEDSEYIMTDTLGQFTGLFDKNGVEIYEGDIYHQGDENIKYKVIYDGAGFIGNQIGNKSLAGIEYFIKDIVIVGNIFDNPELVKKHS